MLARLATVCYRRRWRVLIAWIIALVGVSVLSQTVGGDLLKTFSLPGTESQDAFDVLGRNFVRGDPGDLVFKVNDPGDVQSSPEARAQITKVADEIRRQPHVESVTTPYDNAPGPPSISPTNPKIGRGEIQFNVQSNDVPLDEAADIRKIVKDANTENLQIELGGYMFVEQTMPASELIGVLAAILILLIAFGSLLAMGLPIMTALFGIGIGLAFVQLLAQVMDIPSFAPQVTAMIGIGVGIDYALFISTRYREALHEGAEPEQAVVHSIDTSGRAVLFAGGTVVISVLGLFLIGVSFIRGLAVGSSLAVLFVMAAAVTLLPAVLGFVGHTIDRFALPGARRHKASVEHSFWVRWSRTLQRQPAPALALGLVILVVLTLPVFGMRLGVADTGNESTDQTVRRAYDLLSEGFGPGSNGPLLVVAELTSPNDLATMESLADAINGSPGVAQVSPVIPSPNDGKAALISVTPEGSPQDDSTTKLVHRLRDDVVPRVTGNSSFDVFVGGQTSIGVDLADILGQRLPLMLFAILVLSFILLMLVFRSILVPLKAVVMNLLSIGAAYGVIVAIFQNGWGNSLLGVTEGPIEAWVPMMLFAVVFGLSMDYEVFLLSRIKEEYDRTHDNASAVASGLAKTARLITAAAAIMICVFGSFVLGDQRVLKLMGFGLAFAVFIDATVVRLVLVPATMELLGDRNWWFPKALEWLPRVQVEGKALEAGSPLAPTAKESVPVSGD
jgi:putative drug exporter of the RND superfamily